MRIRAYGILTIVFLCMWIALSTKNQRKESTRNQAERPDVTCDHFIRPFFLHHASDWYYNWINVQPISPEMKQKAEAYANEYLMNCGNPRNQIQCPAKRDEIIKQYIYISSMVGKELDNVYKRENIMLSFYHTMLAYEIAVYFRICAFIYSSVNKNQEKYEGCLILSSYMEWYFSFMFEVKVQGFCNMSALFAYRRNENSRLQAYYICGILGKLNLNFLKLPEETTFLTPLKKDEIQVYKPRVLMRYNKILREPFFKSVLQQYAVPLKTNGQSQDDYDKMVYNGIWDLIMKTYTDEFFLLSRYMYEVTYGLSYSINSYNKSDYEFIKNYVWDNMDAMKSIIDKPTNLPRGMVSNLGEEIFRSNAVEILRQVSYLCVNPVLSATNIDQIQLMIELNSGQPRCHVINAPKILSVDYIFTIMPKSKN